jgi:hypothetical protein
MTKGYIHAIKAIKPDAQVGMQGTEYDGIIWFDETPIDKATLDAKLAELPTKEEEMEAQETLKASAKAKLIAGEALTEEEANTIVL